MIGLINISDIYGQPTGWSMSFKYNALYDSIILKGEYIITFKLVDELS